MQLNLKFRQFSVTLGSLFGVMTLFIALATTQAFAQAQFVTFEAPGAGVSHGQGTVPRSINFWWSITGEYYDSGDAVHGFVRTPNGTITSFDAPGSSTALGQGTYPRSINALGQIAGFYYYVGNSVVTERVTHFSKRPSVIYPSILTELERATALSSTGVYTRGFVRYADGTIDPFDAGRNLGTIPLSINLFGEITGAYSSEGFVRAPNGSITPFSAGVTTVPASINQQGEVTGFYVDTNSMCHGFLRDRRGRIITFDPPGSECTDPESINDFGVIAGDYSDSSGASHGFVRAPNGVITTFNVIEAGEEQSMSAVGINDFGQITGNYLDAAQVLHAFERAPRGFITTFDAPGSSGSCAGCGTGASSINFWGAITGSYTDANLTSHGFLRTQPLFESEGK